MYACMLYIHEERERGSARARLCMCACVRERERKRENKQPCFAIIVVICAKETPTTYLQ